MPGEKFRKLTVDLCQFSSFSPFLSTQHNKIVRTVLNFMTLICQQLVQIHNKIVQYSKTVRLKNFSFFSGPPVYSKTVFLFQISNIPKRHIPKRHVSKVLVDTPVFQISIFIPNLQYSKTTYSKTGLTVRRRKCWKISKNC